MDYYSNGQFVIVFYIKGAFPRLPGLKPKSHPNQGMNLLVIRRTP